MSREIPESVIEGWSRRNLPGRLTVEQTAKLLGFGEDDVQILMRSRKLSPLGDPAPNAPKWFSAIEILTLATDADWLNKATRDISKHWRCKRERRKFTPHSAKKSSPDSSPKVQFKGNETEVASIGRAA